jgi:hypothetical protein
MSSTTRTTHSPAPPLSRKNVGPAYDMFESLRKFQAKAKRLRRSPAPPADDRLQYDEERDVE